jgi:hypothetical protein
MEINVAIEKQVLARLISTIVTGAAVAYGRASSLTRLPSSDPFTPTTVGHILTDSAAFTLFHVPGQPV